VKTECILKIISICIIDWESNWIFFSRLYFSLCRKHKRLELTRRSTSTHCSTITKLN